MESLCIVVQYSASCLLSFHLTHMNMLNDIKLRIVYLMRVLLRLHRSRLLMFRSGTASIKWSHQGRDGRENDSVIVSASRSQNDRQLCALCLWREEIHSSNNPTKRFAQKYSLHLLPSLAAFISGRHNTSLSGHDGIEEIRDSHIHTEIALFFALRPSSPLLYLTQCLVT